MLVISRNPSQSFFIGDDIKVTICQVNGKHVRVGIEAPKDITILREEIADKYRANGGNGHDGK